MANFRPVKAELFHTDAPGRERGRPAQQRSRQVAIQVSLMPDTVDTVLMIS